MRLQNILEKMDAPSVKTAALKSRRKKARNKVLKLLDDFEKSDTIKKANKIANKILSIVMNEDFGSAEVFETNVTNSSRQTGLNVEAKMKYFRLIHEGHEELKASNIPSVISLLKSVPMQLDSKEMRTTFRNAMDKISVTKKFLLARNPDLKEAFDLAEVTIRRLKSQTKVAIAKEQTKVTLSEHQHSDNAVAIAKEQTKVKLSEHQHSDNAVAIAKEQTKVKLSEHQHSDNAVAIVGVEQQDVAAQAQLSGDEEAKKVLKYTPTKTVHFFSRCYQRGILFSEAKRCRLYGTRDDTFDPNNPDSIKYHDNRRGVTLCVLKCDEDKF